MIGKMTKAEFDRLDEDDQWMTVAGHDVTPSAPAPAPAPAPTLQEQINQRDAVIESQQQSLQKAEVAINQASQTIARYLEARSKS